MHSTAACVWGRWHNSCHSFFVGALSHTPQQKDILLNCKFRARRAHRCNGISMARFSRIYRSVLRTAWFPGFNHSVAFKCDLALIVNSLKRFCMSCECACPIRNKNGMVGVGDTHTHTHTYIDKCLHIHVNCPARRRLTKAQRFYGRKTTLNAAPARNFTHASPVARRPHRKREALNGSMEMYTLCVMLCNIYIFSCETKELHAPCCICCLTCRMRDVHTLTHLCSDLKCAAPSSWRRWASLVWCAHFKVLAQFCTHLLYEYACVCVNCVDSGVTHMRQGQLQKSWY